MAPGAAQWDLDLAYYSLSFPGTSRTSRKKMKLTGTTWNPMDGTHWTQTESVATQWTLVGAQWRLLGPTETSWNIKETNKTEWNQLGTRGVETEPNQLQWNLLHGNGTLQRVKQDLITSRATYWNGA